ncbi:hypothetical protein QBC41DRAFT_309693 [Cercophora samala]|uniref:Uncharacterized protein n=1 Tax=Cercophora samala TaxID=330535 RepID=A0AA39ZN48_9PEZI|nr:hypothetical protein QBC41DRAFT_309693 [Cercophora samala]
MAATMPAATMDDAARLVSELHDKLAELDGKVAAYQRDMLAEFHKHMEDCLKDYPDDISKKVSRVIAESMSRYPALSPTSHDMADSPATNHHTLKTPGWKGRKSPPPVLPHTSGVPKEGPRSPHEREKEFQGVFTPTYLPLLESNERSSYRSPPTSPVSVPTVVQQQQQQQQQPQQPPPPPQQFPQQELQTPAPLSVDNVKKVEEIKKPEAPVKGRPDPIRRLTDRSTSSVESSSSDSKVRRSALRRRSSSVKGAASPRRVRFDFSGEEVFPSSSPQQAASPVAMAVEDDEADKPKAELLPVVETPATSTAAVVEDESPEPEEDYCGTSLLDVEGEEDFLPRPKKVSSTQALQALTRSPLEEGSFWTVVNANNNEESGKVNGQKEKEKANTPAPAPVKVDSQVTLRPIDGPGEDTPVSGLLGSPIEELEQYIDDDESEEEFLSMRPKNSKKSPSPGGQTPFKSPPASRFSSSNQTPMSSGTSKTNGKQDVLEEDPLFDFEDGENGTGKTEKYLPEQEDDSDDDDGVEVRIPHRPMRMTPTPLQTVLEDENKKHSRTTSLPPVSPSAVLFGHSVGSFKGNSFSLNPIKNTKLYDEIAGLKDVHFFVGSVDGRSGAEAADMGSYRAMSKGVPVVPRSFTERLAIEEAMERRKEEEDDE